LIESANESTILISSHDLAEIESFASHVGYLDRGKLQFSEEMTALSARFREVEVTLDAAATLPANWPPAWLRVETSPSVVRFVESQFDDARTMAEVRKIFGEPHGIAITPMPLRSIFVTLAKAERRAA
jgi:ABC-2 type transport system ATP-binding protein